MTEPSASPERALEPHIRLARLRAEAALVRRLNAGYGFADPSLPAQLFLRDEAARERLGRDPLRPRDTHEEQASELEEEIADLAARLEVHASPLADLVDGFRLSPAESALLGIAVAYELDRDVRELAHALAAPRRGALFGDVCQEIAPELSSTSALLGALHPNATLIWCRLVELKEDRGATHASAARALSCSRRVIDWLLGDERIAAPLHLLLEVIPSERDLGVYLGGDVTEQVERVAGLLRAHRSEPGARAPAVLIQGPMGCGKLAAAHRIAAALGSPLAKIPLPGLLAPHGAGRDPGLAREALTEARLRDAVPYLPAVEALTDSDAGEAAAAVVDAVNRYPGIAILSTREKGLPSLPFSRPFHLVRIGRPGLELRRQAWEHGLVRLGDAADLQPDAADSLAARYVVGPGTIGEVLREAHDFARATGNPVRRMGIEEAVGRRLTLRLGAFGTLIQRRARFEEMVLPEDIIETLRHMIAMVSERAKIMETWGYAKHLGISRGVSALFSGEPGTGKTMAASVISSELGLELIRIDLSAVVSKWVGETEKHLARIFDEAEHANAMLVFDEADSLFGKRTEIKTAQDRFANLEVNYILQRMESFDGICILTSNMQASIDQAFLRRLNFRVRFPKPEIEERIELWKKLLPPETGLGEGLDLRGLAERFEMTGGHIRNAIVRAAVVAARENRRMTPRDLVAGAHLEYLELGKVMPDLPGD